MRFGRGTRRSAPFRHECNDSASLRGDHQRQQQTAATALPSDACDCTVSTFLTCHDDPY
jgi:hypothetical protein